MESSIETIAIGNWKTRKSMQVFKSDLELQDLPVDFDEITALQDSSVFRILPVKDVPAKS